MHVIVLKYVQVLCITIFFSNNINCDKLLVQNAQEDQELYRIGACTAACLAGTHDTPADNATSPDLKSVRPCYELCADDRRPESAWRPLVRRRDPSLRINLICRDSTNLIIEIQRRTPADGESVNVNEHGTGSSDEDDDGDVPGLAWPALTRDAVAPQAAGKLNQLEVPLETAPNDGESLTMEDTGTGGLTVRRKRAIGTASGPPPPPPPTDLRPPLVLSDGGNHLPGASRGPEWSSGKHGAPGKGRGNAPSRPTIPARLPIYLVKVQESEQQLGDRIVYVCPFTKLDRLPADKGNTVLKVDASRQFALRVLDRDVGRYAYANDSSFCQLSSVQLGEFGVYDLRLNAADGACALETAKEPVNIYLPFLTIAALVLLLVGAVRLARFAIERSRRLPGQRPVATAATEPTTEPDGESDKREGTETVAHAAAPPKKRLQSLDTFRGIAIMLMIFVNSGGGHYWWIEHATWNGLHVADLVFPWFLFIMGVCVPISLRAQLSRNVPRRTIATNIAIRSLKLFAIGLCLNSANGPSVASLRLFGVLQRFGVAYFVVSMVHLCCYEPSETVPSQNRIVRAHGDIFRLRKQWLIVGLLTVLYLAVILFVPAPGCPSGYFGPGGSHLLRAYPNCTGGITGYIDRTLLGLGHLYQHPTARYVYDALPFDPEGPFGCLPTILQVFLGLQCGCTILAHADHRQRMVRFGVWSLALGLAAGALCGFSKNDGWLPVNKNLWSLSYVLATAALAYLLLLLCYYAVDVRRAWTGRPFLYAGMNAIVLYVGHTVFHKMLPWHWRIGTMNTHLMLTLEALWNTVLWNLVALYLFRRRKFYNL